MRRRIAAGKPPLPRHGAARMDLCVLHYHFRSGGVRRVIELGLPALVRAMGCTRVAMLAGEAPPADWRAQMEAALYPCTVKWHAEPAAGYWSEQKLPVPDARAAIREALLSHTTGLTRPLWAHNLSVGRNLLLAQEVAALPGHAMRWLHHHDWWWDGRWERWPEFKAQGFETLATALAVTLPSGTLTRHFCVNLTDALRLTEWTGQPFHFLPNPLTMPAVAPQEVEAARAFLRRTTGADRWWLYPCRALRRKNIAETLLVQKGLAPEAVIVTTGGPSSAAEEDYFSHLTNTATARGWPLVTAVGTLKNNPSVAALTAAADAVVITSLKEGFGLPYSEAALARRPCFARVPSGLEETLRHLHMPLSGRWAVLPVPREWFDGVREEARTARLRESLPALLPPELQHAALTLPDPDKTGGVDFGTLTLEAQLEVLSAASADSPLFPAALRQHTPAPPPRPDFAAKWFPEPWAGRFLDWIKMEPARPQPADWPRSAPRDLAPLLHHWLTHPLLWPA